MSSRASIEERFRIARIILFLAWAGLTAAIVVWAVKAASERAEVEVRQKAGETLSVQIETLTGVLDKYRLMAPLLARQSSIASLFVRDAGNNPQEVAARRMAEELAGMAAAQDVAFLFPDGEILAHAQQGPFVEAGIGLDDLVAAAAQGRLGRAFLSLADGTRAYAFSSGVRRNNVLIGIVIVYVDFFRIEAAWALSTRPIFVTDATQTVILANETGWRMRQLSAIATPAGDRLSVLRDGQDRVFIDLKRRLQVLDWDLHVLADPQQISEARASAGAIATLSCLLAGLVALIVMRRGETALLRARADRATALRLERVVRDRTQALSESNLSLSREVDVRRMAEERLRKAQADLVQSAKLAALGQMSAALSHEFNQPLAAIRSYADNAATFLERGHSEPVAENLGRINNLVDRMAELSRTLLSFARRPGSTISPVDLDTVIGEAMLLARPRAKAAGVEIRISQDIAGIRVLGGRVRLSQVFVNLVNNAVDAIGMRGDGLIEIDAASKTTTVDIEVRDNGPGIDVDKIAQIFEPFFTTKGTGEGIGIGLSIVDKIVRDFGGRISVRNSADGGAVFTVTLRLAPGRDDKSTPGAIADASA